MPMQLGVLLERGLPGLVAVPQTLVAAQKRALTTEVAGLTYDSRRVAPGTVFAAWRGQRSDGHRFVAQAVAQGAIAVLCEEVPQGAVASDTPGWWWLGQDDDDAVPVCVVPSGRRALARLAGVFHDEPWRDLRLVGVTGTNGKTTTTHLLRSVFAAAGWSAGQVGTLGAQRSLGSVDIQLPIHDELSQKPSCASSESRPRRTASATAGSLFRVTASLPSHSALNSGSECPQTLGLQASEPAVQGAAPHSARHAREGGHLEEHSEPRSWIPASAGMTASQVGTTGGAECQQNLTTPESVELMQQLAYMREQGVSAVAMEASSHGLQQGRLGALQFDVGVVLNVTQDHLDYHGTMDAYASAKALLWQEHVRRGGTLVANMDDPIVAGLLARHEAQTNEHQVMTFSAKGDRRASFWASGVQADGAGLRFTLCWHRTAQVCQQRAVRLRLVGDFQVSNVLATVAAARALGVSMDAVVQGLAKASPVPGRMQRVVMEPRALARGGDVDTAADADHDQPQPAVLVDYAHTPDALAHVLASVRRFTLGRVWCVFGCGGDRDVDKRAPMGTAVAEHAHVAVLTSDNPRSEKPEQITAMVEPGLQQVGWAAVRADSLGSMSGDEVSTGLPATTQRLRGTYAVVLDRAVAITRAIAAAAPDDTVVIAGKGHEQQQWIGSERRPFDDAQVAQQALQQRLRDGAAYVCEAQQTVTQRHTGGEAA